MEENCDNLRKEFSRCYITIFFVYYETSACELYESLSVVHGCEYITSRGIDKLISLK